MPVRSEGLSRYGPHACRRKTSVTTKNKRYLGARAPLSLLSCITMPQAPTQELERSNSRGQFNGGILNREE
ncbi:uncharacterized [Tachysurus ichikawai]